MSIFLLKRLITLIVTLLGASIVVFAVLEILPGDAAQMLMGPDAEPEAVQAMVQQLGLDQPALTRYGQWINGLLHGDMGNSYAYGSPVSELVWERLLVTVPLAVLAMLITAVLAIAAGVFAAARHKRWGDIGVMGLAQIGIAIPNFWFAILLILLFSVKLQWFSAGGFPGWREEDGGGFWPALQALLLPAISGRGAGCHPGAHHALCRAGGTARGFCTHGACQGCPAAPRWGHVLRNAMIPVVTVMGLQFANLLAGTIVVESVFYLPGLGRLIFQSISNRDVIVVRNCVLLLAAMVVFVNFVVDMLYAFIDPRIQASDI